MNLPKSQMENKRRVNINISRKNQTITKKSGKTKNPINENTPTAIKNINPTRNSFIIRDFPVFNTA
jgi:hypothetical protein